MLSKKNNTKVFDKIADIVISNTYARMLCEIQ